MLLKRTSVIPNATAAGLPTGEYLHAKNHHLKGVTGVYFLMRETQKGKAVVPPIM